LHAVGVWRVNGRINSSVTRALDSQLREPKFEPYTAVLSCQTLDSLRSCVNEWHAIDNG